MTLVRILVEGQPLLQQWNEVAPGKPRDSEVAREELINKLITYYDACETPLTVIFDKHTAGEDTSPPTLPEVEVLFCRPGQSTIQLIDRLAYKLSATGQIMVVTNDTALQERIRALGGLAHSCEAFIALVGTALADLEKKILRFNQTEQQKFTQHG